MTELAARLSEYMGVCAVGFALLIPAILITTAGVFVSLKYRVGYGLIILGAALSGMAVWATIDVWLVGSEISNHLLFLTRVIAVMMGMLVMTGSLVNRNLIKNSQEG